MTVDGELISALVPAKRNNHAQSNHYSSDHRGLGGLFFG